MNRQRNGSKKKQQKAVSAVVCAVTAVSKFSPRHDSVLRAPPVCCSERFSAASQKTNFVVVVLSH